ncbi:MAG TPA: class I SAM-dependent methyltransferase [Candidatus Angelobacter sp.]|nr:class I SAM-dependent methyltransferase [Candidatus Angelobacter sp.]
MQSIDKHSYPLGHSEQERERLKRQAALYQDVTLRVFRQAGITSGMRVLDVGCGVGDVSFAARQLVGENGQVFGIDRSADAVAEATERARDAGWKNVHFEIGDCGSFDSPTTFDAVVGRLVLLYQPDPAQTVKSLMRMLKKNGIVSFLEYDMKLAPACYPSNPLFEWILSIVLTAFERSGVRLRMGAELHSTFVRAGLTPPVLHVEIPAGAGPDWVGYDVFTGVTRSLLPAIEKFGIATAEEIDIDTLADRLRDECVRAGAVTLTPAIVGAWSRVP